MSADTKTIVGRTIRILRESKDLSQEKLAERAGITYQYLSAVENGKENFTVGVLEAVALALGTELPLLIEQAYSAQSPVPTAIPKFFVRQAVLPPRLSIEHIESAMNETHKIVRLLNATLIRASGRPLSAYIKGNNFSGIISNILCDSFSRLTPYKHNHDQRYPDLVCKAKDDRLIAGLEVKCTVRPGKGGESHNGHSGWHIIACFRLESDSGDIRFTHVMLSDLTGHGKPDADWKYVGGKVNKDTGSQRTETYVTTGKGTAKLRHGSVYLDMDFINTDRWRTSLDIEAPAYSPFKKNR
ncbi:MAG: helix-turn-helix transcriptional regulator [Deltaproteobacteria bacterium]|nr:helix-turn-helix transcriptional regulator [Deltaproteobacteria bacterium]